MSRSSYSTEDRDYESRRERERERSRNADRYDGETRHHGKWTASGEASDLEGSMMGRDHSSRKSSGLGNRSYSDREMHDSEFSRNRGSSNLGYSSGFGSSYDSGYGSSSIPVPPPMPPADFYMPHSNYRQSQHYGSGMSSGYGSHYGGSGSGYDHYGSSAYGSHLGSGLGSSYGHPTYSSYPTHSTLGSTYGGLGGLGSHPAAAYPHHYGTPAFGSHLGSGYGHPTALSALPHQYGPGYQATQIYGSDYYFGQPGYGASSGLGSRSRGLRQKRGPKSDIYELGNDYIIEMDLPGHSREHIDVKLAGNELYVISKPPARTHNFHINERSLGNKHIERKFYLPADVTATSISPVLTNGVLRLVLPRNAALVTPSTTTSTLASAVKPHTTTTTDTVTTTTATNQVL